MVGGKRGTGGARLVGCSVNGALDARRACNSGFVSLRGMLFCELAGLGDAAYEADETVAVAVGWDGGDLGFSAG